jgi:hypothetical protein
MSIVGRRIFIFVASMSLTVGVAWLVLRQEGASGSAIDSAPLVASDAPAPPGPRARGGRERPHIRAGGHPGGSMDGQTGASAAPAGVRALPILTVEDLYKVNRMLIPSFHAEGKKHYKKPELVKAYQDCGRDYALRQRLELPGEVDLELAYTLEVKNGKARLVDVERLEGGDDVLVDCIWRAQQWWHEPFDAPEAAEGTFRWSTDRQVALVPLS